jgi:hypothetical protein
MTRRKTTRFVVDRREGVFFVLQDERGKTRDVAAAKLPPACRREGAVIEVPMSAKGELEWKSAERNREEELRRLREAAKQLEKLRQTDPGGNLEL